jgi:hypothetical protein
MSVPAMISAGPLRPTCMVPADARAEVVLLRDGAEVASWPLVCEGGKVDLRVVDALARLQLKARRQGCTVWLRDACPNLVELVDLVGLAGVLEVGQPAREAGPEVSPHLQVWRQPEGLEERGVEEVVVPDDPVT